MQKSFLCILFTIILSVSLFADLPTKPIKQQTIECIRTTEPVIIDGQYDKAWSKAKKYYMYEIESLKAPLSTGIVMTMYDGRTNLSIQVVEEVKKYFGKKVYRSVIPRNVGLSEAPSFGEPIIVFDRSATGAIAYERLAREFLEKNK